ncbi:DUF885 domain-containing protein [Hominifimenecus sp. rT4P-3]|uniref:DUF885 domain-containing protein n=1 Tax=Hominifimenecus sp. rT4P-3 TaxID=3242979 RepID=UPI003DA359B6
MMRKRFFSLIACLLAFLLLLGSCQSAPPSGTSTSLESDAGSSDAATEAAPQKDQIQQEFDQFIEDLFLENVVSDTISLHYTLSDPSAMGITEIPITFGDFGNAAYEEAIQTLKDTRAKLSTFSYELLSGDQQLTYDILMAHLTTELQAEDYELYAEALGPTTGIQAQLPVLLAEYTFYQINDIDTYLALLEKLPDYYASILDFEKRKSEAGLFFCDETVDGVIESCENFIANPESNYLIDIFNDKVEEIEGLSDQQKSDYCQRNQEQIEKFVIPAYRMLSDGLRALKGSGTNEKGMAGFQGGIAYYTYLAASSTGSSWTPEEMIERITNRMAKDVMGIGTVAQSDPDWMEKFDSFQFGITEPTDMLEDLKQKITKDFPELAGTSYKVNYVHESLEQNSSPAFFLTPPIDRNTENAIYINRSSSTGGLYTTLAHEGYPGHLYQNVYFNRTEPCHLRHLLNFTGYSEGWATYVENLSYEYNTNADSSAILLQQLNNSLSLELSALADLYVNYKGYSLEELQTFFSGFGYGDAETVKSIFDYVVAEPGAYLPYVIGWLEIEDLKETAQTTLGEKFNLKEFHRFLLDIGPAPFDVIEKYMNEWIETQ